MSTSPPSFDLAAVAAEALAADRRAASRPSAAHAPAAAAAAPAPAAVATPSAPAEAAAPVSPPASAAVAAAPAPAETQGSPVVAMTTATPATAAASPAPRAKRGPKKRTVTGPKKRGPKPKAAADLRTKCVSVWMNEAEIAALDARRGELARGEWLRVVEAGAVPPAPPTALNLEAWRKLATALGNLNQIAHALNIDAQGGGARAALDSEIKQTLAEVRAFRDALIGADLPRAARAARAERAPKQKARELGAV